MKFISITNDGVAGPFECLAFQHPGDAIGGQAIVNHYDHRRVLLIGCPFGSDIMTVATTGFL